MAVHNASAYVRLAIDSILNQSVRNLEFIIIDDCSTDDSAAIIESYRDPRIRFIRNEKQSGLAFSLNRGLDMASGSFIARMDADDISHPDRLQLQLAYMAKNRLDVCGGAISRIDANGNVFKKRVAYSGSDKQLKANTVLSPQFFHPAVVFRSSFLKKQNVEYDETYRRAQDFELWSRLVFGVDKVRFGNVDKLVLSYRDLPDSNAKSTRNTYQSEVADSIRVLNLTRLAVPYRQSYPVLNKFLRKEKLSKSELFRLVVLFRGLNVRSLERFGACPQVSSLFPLQWVGGGGIVLYWRERLYRNQVFLKQLRQFLTVLQSILLKRNKLA